jgi:hypothetical protein
MAQLETIKGRIFCLKYTVSGLQTTFVVGGVVDPGVSPGFIGKGVFLSFWHAKIIPSKKITRILFIFFG